uniref:Uncharacterized protein n=1 Tax=Bicosoecida sp. CB-2014 TaxID=1486930 RepID=A0A7S1CN40_9STRA
MAHEEEKRPSDPLGEKLITLIRRQKTASDEYTALLTKKDGLKENTRMAIKNLEAAVVQSKRAGYFKYHEPTEEVDRIERGALLSKKLKEIQDLQAEIDEVNAAIKARHEAELVARPKELGSLKEFFAEYGRPDPVMFEPLRTEFHAHAKVYGGSTHYSSFKSVAVDMKKGRVTR